MAEATKTTAPTMFDMQIDCRGMVLIQQKQEFHNSERGTTSHRVSMMIMGSTISVYIDEKVWNQLSEGMIYQFEAKLTALGKDLRLLNPTFNRVEYGI